MVGVGQWLKALSPFPSHPEGVPEVPLTPETVSVELRPLMLWMANTTELLSFVQEKVLEMEKEADQEGKPWPRPMFVQTPSHSLHLGTWVSAWHPLVLLLTPMPVFRPTTLQWLGIMWWGNGPPGWGHHVYLPAVCLLPHQGMPPVWHGITSCLNCITLLWCHFLFDLTRFPASLTSLPMSPQATLLPVWDYITSCLSDFLSLQLSSLDWLTLLSGYITITAFSSSCFLSPLLSHW